MIARLFAVLVMGVALAALQPASSGEMSNSIRARTCEAHPNHRYEQVGMTGTWTCVKYYKDGGKECSERSQCEGGCIYEAGHPGEPAVDPMKGDNVKGICQRSDAQFGCYATVEHGRLTADLMCVD